jgi:hypothetical protein
MRLACFVSAMPMYGVGEGYMQRIEMTSPDAALVVGRGMLKTGGFLFVEIEDVDGKILVVKTS